MASQLFEKFSPRIAGLPDRRLSTSDLMTEAFLLDREDELAVYYVPFERINPAAQVVLIGITPGFTQMRIAFEVARDGLHAGLPRAEILEAVDQPRALRGQCAPTWTGCLMTLACPSYSASRTQSNSLATTPA